MPDTLQTWTSATWQAEAHAWVLARLRAHGILARGPVTAVHTRFWSTVHRVETTAGTCWFKENAPGQRGEAALVARLDELVPGHVVPPLAVHPGRGWLLSPDGGPTLRDVGATDAAWRRVVREYAGVQRTLVPHREAVLATGVTVMDPAHAAPYLRTHLDRQATLPVEHPFHLPAEVVAGIAAGTPRLEAAVAVLAEAGLPLSLDHNDLHDANAFAGTGTGTGTGDRPLRFFDLGDAVWGHPLSTLRVPAGTLREAGTDPTIVDAVLDEALEVWSDLLPLPRLRALLPAAFRLGALSRYESWRRLLVDQPLAVQRDFAGTLRWWLGEATAPGD